MLEQRFPRCAACVRRLALVVVASVLAASAASAQGTATARPDDPIYRDIDRLIDAGLIDTVIVGQRPYSWATVGRLVRQARSRRAGLVGADVRAPSAQVTGALERASQRLGVEAPGELRLMLSGEALFTDMPTRGVPGNGLGTVEADLNTLTNYQLGRRYLRGANTALEGDISAQATRRLAIQARGRLWAHSGGGAIPSGTAGDLLAASVRFVAANAALTVGREYTLWTPAPDGGTFFSENAPGLDMIRLASDRPFVLPWLLRYLGPVGATIQLADLGRSQRNSHSQLVSYKVSVLPLRDLELGATFMNHFGGEGARNPSAINRFIDLVPFIDIFKRHHDSTDFDSDKLLGVDARLRLRQAGNVTLFGELTLEDFDIHRPKSVLTEDAAWSLGVIIPELGTPALSARLRFHTLGIRFYQHHLVQNGIASRRYTLGDDLGRDATGYSALLRWDGGSGLTFTGDVAVEERRNDKYLGEYVNADSLTGLEFRRIATLPREGRARGLLGLEWRPVGGRIVFDARGGVERVSNFAFVAGGASTHGVGALKAAFFR
jgi:Capsule assembly protein Wzi